LPIKATPREMPVRARARPVQSTPMSVAARSRLVHQPL
jgi:hypothetical protein